MGAEVYEFSAEFGRYPADFMATCSSVIYVRYGHDSDLFS